MKLEKNFNVDYIKKLLGARFEYYTIEVSNRTPNRIYIYKKYENRLMINITGEVVTYFEPISKYQFKPVPEVTGKAWKRGLQVAYIKVENIEKAVEIISSITNF